MSDNVLWSSRGTDSFVTVWLLSSAPLIAVVRIASSLVLLSLLYTFFILFTSAVSCPRDTRRSASSSTVFVKTVCSVLTWLPFYVSCRQKLFPQTWRDSVAGYWLTPTVQHCQFLRTAYQNSWPEWRCKCRLRTWLVYSCHRLPWDR